MAERSGFYNAVLQSDGSYDRIYQAEDFSDCLNLFIPTGIYVTEEESEQETIDKTTVEGLKPYGSGTSLMIKQGSAFIKGQWYVIDEQDLEIPLTINTTKVIVLMHTVVDRETKVQLIDYVNDEIVVPQNDAQFGILLGTVEYTISGVMVTDLREDFMNSSPKAVKIVLDNIQNKINEYKVTIEKQNETIEKQNEIIEKLNSIMPDSECVILGVQSKSVTGSGYVTFDKVYDKLKNQELREKAISIFGIYVLYRSEEDYYDISFPSVHLLSGTLFQDIQINIDKNERKIYFTNMADSDLKTFIVLFVVGESWETILEKYLS